MRRSALASTCTSWLAAASLVAAAAPAVAGDTAPDPARVLALELEANLAKKPAVYLVLDAPRRLLEIRSRGVVLDQVSLLGLEVVAQRRLLASASASAVEVPAVWTITEGAGDNDREVIAPDELRPYSEEDEEEEPAPAQQAALGAATPAPTPTATTFPEPPTSYRARLDNGWDLWVCEQLPPQSAWRRFAAAVRDGWRRLRGDGKDYPTALALEVAADDARRLHHLLRAGTPVLLTTGS